MHVSPGSSKGKSGKGDKKLRGVCWDCGEKGHYKGSEKCLKPKKAVEKEKGDSAKGKGSANTVEESDSESRGAFMLEPNLESSSDIPDLLTVSSSSDVDDKELDNPDLEEGDWFSEIGEDETDGEDAYLMKESAFINESTPVDKPIRAEVYNSRCTTHISPYLEDLENFTEISP